MRVCLCSQEHGPLFKVGKKIVLPLQGGSCTHSGLLIEVNSCPGFFPEENLDLQVRGSCQNSRTGSGS